MSIERGEIISDTLPDSVIHFRAVTRHFDDVIAVGGVDLNVAAGCFVALVGASGSGKSTLMKMVNGLEQPTTGQIIFAGEDVSTQPPAKLRRRIGYVFQSIGLFPHMNVAENIGIGPRLSGQRLNDGRIRELLELVELEADMTSRMPDELSGGQRQRVGVARALANEPELLLMDEPFSALDPLIRRQLQDEFIRLSQILRKTTIFITHDLDEAVRIGDRIAIMRDGRVVQIGTAEDIVMNPADDYVSDFVAGISRLKVVHAHAVMQPIADHVTAHGPLPADAARVGEGETLSTLINLAIDRDDAIVVEQNGRDVGVITRADILRTVIEGTEMS